MTGKLVRFLVVTVAVVVAINAAVAAFAFVLKSRMRSWGDESSDSIELVSIMDGVEFESRAKGFSGGSVFTMMGSTEMDLRDVELSEHGGFLQVRTIMGSTEIVVPENWRVVLEGTAVMGVNEKTLNSPDLPEDAPRLELDARTYCGALEISHAPRVPAAEGV
jgi:hypothetical protein